MQFNPMQPTQNYERDQAAAKYRIARLNVMLMLAFTLINIVLLFAESDSFFLFSAMLPYLAVIFGTVIGGTGALVGGIAVAIVILGVYFVLWLFSKKKPDFMIPLLVLFILDTLCTLGFYLIAWDLSAVLNLIFHGWVIYYLAMGIRYGQKLKRLPEQQAQQAEPATVDKASEKQTAVPFPDTPALREADLTAKHRVLLAHEYPGYSICYRRVKRSNELVINGVVYAEYIALAERAHALRAIVGGHCIEAGFDGMRSYIAVDGTLCQSKVRWI